MNPFIHALPITKIKIAIARILYRLVRVVVHSDIRVINRGGIAYEIDLSEGIDLSLFLFGSFQKHVYQNRFVSFAGDEVIFDVGANAGFMALRFAKLVPRGAVHAFEPTHYAFAKLQKNISRNPALKDRIITNNLFLSSAANADPHITAYASWKVNGERLSTDHPVHRGSSKGAEGVAATTLDDYMEKSGLKRLHFIKIDTDGHEWDVLLGAKNTIQMFQPVVLFEVGDYVMKERGISFEDYLSYFEGFGYRLYDSKSEAALTRDTYGKQIPLLGSIDAIAVPVKSQ